MIIFERRRLIGLAGKKQVGKTTAQIYLMKSHGFLPMNFANPLKKGLAAMTGLSEDYFFNQDLKEKPIDFLDGITPRKLMQIVGTDCFRKMVGSDFWTRIMEHNIRNCSSGSICVGDIRFQEEADLIRSLGGTVVLINRDVPDQNDDEHESESLNVTVDHIIFNNGTLNDFKEKLEYIVERV